MVSTAEQISCTYVLSRELLPLDCGREKVESTEGDILLGMRCTLEANSHHRGSSIVLYSADDKFS